MARHLPSNPLFTGSTFTGSFSKIGQLSSPQHDGALLPVVRRENNRALTRAASRVLQSMIESRKDLQVVADFRNKLRTAEDLVSKLGFSLREIQGSRRKRTDSRKKSARRNEASESSNVVLFAKLEASSEDRCI